MSQEKMSSSNHQENEVLEEATMRLEKCVRIYRELEDKVYDILVRQEKGRKIQGAMRLSWLASAHKKTLDGVELKAAETDRQVRELENFVSGYVEVGVIVPADVVASNNNRLRTMRSPLRNTAGDVEETETSSLPTEDELLMDEDSEDPRARVGAFYGNNTQRREQALDVEFALELSRSAEIGRPTGRLRKIWAEDGGYDDQLNEMLLAYLDKASDVTNPQANVCIEFWDEDDDTLLPITKYEQKKNQFLKETTPPQTPPQRGERNNISINTPQQQQQYANSSSISESLAASMAETLAKLKSRNVHDSAEACRKISDECSNENDENSSAARRYIARGGGIEMLVTYLGDVSRRDKRSICAALRALSLEPECSRQMFENGALSRIWSLLAAAYSAKESAPELVRLWQALAPMPEYTRMTRTALGQDANTAADVVIIVTRTNDLTERVLAVSALEAMVAPDPGVDVLGSTFKTQARRSALLNAGAPRCLITLLQKAAKQTDPGLYGTHSSRVVIDPSVSDDRVVDAVAGAVLGLVWQIEQPKDIFDEESLSPKKNDATFDDDLLKLPRARVIQAVSGLLPEAVAMSDARDAAYELIRIHFQRMVEASYSNQNNDLRYCDDIVSLLRASSASNQTSQDMAVIRHGCRALRQLYPNDVKNIVFTRYGAILAALVKSVIKIPSSRLTTETLYAKTEAAELIRQFAPRNAELLGTDDQVQALVDCCHESDPKNHNQLLQAMLLALHALVQNNKNARAKFLELHGIALLRSYLIGGVTCLAHESAINMLADYSRADDRVKLRLKNDQKFCQAAFDLAQQGGDNLVVHEAAKNLLPILDIDVPDPVGHLPRKFKAPINPSPISASPPVVNLQKKKSSNSPSLAKRLIPRLSTGSKKNSPSGTRSSFH
eukprot:CAMPEP_0197285916 /NCGR_PEP_ID=MMETSP0890-20130614/1281_1 /TAXON_ID=44058 ORGANISM="Aureoumbra lagunensis, Strain CCMP1510" /NCGR_SAMPLE_ID=MMETSP0890 /ASSEMBLY_ACC=CAM_ASM_000533 /LENGTH=898 /DNA_ID=CAMNT_0042753825 /DNA_START=115 /DNA_END=2811 /DNA_ORIENTATION=-